VALPGSPHLQIAGGFAAPRLCSAAGRLNIPACDARFPGAARGREAVADGARGGASARRVPAMSVHPPLALALVTRCRRREEPNLTIREPVRKPQAMSEKQYVYKFGGGKADGSAGMKNELGGKGANLAEMNLIGLPVPAGFTLSTEVCTYYYANDRQYPPELKAQVETALKNVEE